MARKEDKHGQYQTDAGNPYPLTEDEAGYVPCNAVLKFTFERYGERRYCSALALENFHKHDVDTDYEHPEFCKHHQSRHDIMKSHADKHKTGAHAKSHKHKFQYMPPHKQVMANDLYASLLNESTYEFETDVVDMTIDVEDSDFAGEHIDEIALKHQVPTEHEIRGKALWHAALDFVTMESIREEQFRVAAQEEHKGRSLAIGETTTVVTVTDDGREIRDTDEHHLNLPLSRLQKDYKNHMKFGGVSYDVDGDEEAMSTREWVAVVEPDEPEMAPEADTGTSSPLDDVDVPEIED